MPTNKERREVANELRYVASHSLNGYSFQRSVEGMVFGTIGDRSWRETLTRLADLIEPEPERTCFKVIPNEMEGYVFCSECGAEIGEYGVPKYCHNCGAKVE